MAVTLKTPFTVVNRRSGIKGSGDVLTGRWVQLDANGKVTTLDPTKGGSYFVVEGNILHTGSATDFSGATSTKYVNLPSVDAVGAIALAYGVFRVEVGPEGVLQSDANFAVGAPLYLDSSGRLITTAGSAIKVAVVESVTGTQNAWTSITIRTVSQ